MPRRLDEELVRRFILSLPDTSEGTHHGHPDFRVAGRIFAGLSPDRHTVNMRCDPVNLSFLTRQAPNVYRDVWGGKWMGITLSLAVPRNVMELLMDAWRLAAPKSLANTSLPKARVPEGKRDTQAAARRSGAKKGE